MKRRKFLQNICAMGAASAVPGPVWAALSDSKIKELTTNYPTTFNFNEEVDRSGTWSVKIGNSEEKDSRKLGMWIADMDYRTDPYVSKALRERLQRDVMGYTYVPDVYYKAIKDWYLKRHHWDIPQEWIIQGTGVITTINMAYETFTKPGDKIIIQPPVYDHFSLFIKKLNRVELDNPLIYENGKFRMDFEQLENLMEQKPKIMLLCNPHNPGGLVWSKEDLSKVAEICERHGVIVFSDEIHCDLAHSGYTYTPFCSSSKTAARIGLTFTGPTKTFNLAGITCTSHCVIPNEKYRKALEEYLACHKLDEPSIMSMVATIAGYNSPTGWLDQMKAYLEENKKCLLDYFINEIPKIKPVVPQASFLVFLDCRELHLSQDELMNLFREKAGVVVNNGMSYGKEGEGFVRINIGCTRKKLTTALERIKSEVNRLK